MLKKRKNYIIILILVIALIIIGINFYQNSDMQLSPPILKKLGKSSPFPSTTPSTTPTPSPSTSCTWSKHISVRASATGEYEQGGNNPIEAVYPRIDHPERDPPTWNNNDCTNYCTSKISGEAVQKCQEYLNVQPVSCTSPCEFFTEIVNSCQIYPQQSSINGYYLGNDESFVYCGCMGESIAIGDLNYGCKITSAGV